MIIPPYDDPPVRSRSSRRLPWLLGGGAVLAAVLCFGGAAVLLWSFWTGGPDEDLPAAVATARAAPVPASAAPAPADVATWPELAVLPATAEPTLRSATTGAPTMVAFVNAGAAPVTVSWLDQNGKRVTYQVLEPGQSYTQPTYVGHPWVVSGPDGRAVAVFQPAATPGRAVLR